MVRDRSEWGVRSFPLAKITQIRVPVTEEIYQQSLEPELSLRKFPFLSKQEVEGYYKGHKLLTWYKPDLLVQGAMVPRASLCRPNGSVDRASCRQPSQVFLLGVLLDLS